MFSTSLLQEALREGDEVHLLAKEYAQALLRPTFPNLRFISFDAPWTKYRGKYQLWRWKWAQLCSLVLRLRRERYDAVVSVRNDPRDHLIMKLIGARERIGFPRLKSQVFLTHPLTPHTPPQHKVEDWREIGTVLGLDGIAHSAPRLDRGVSFSPRIESALAGVNKPILCIHMGARISVRRWPEAFFKATIERLRAEFDFHLVLIPDQDGFGSTLETAADTVFTDLTLSEMMDALSRSDLLLCNDSGPGHVAAACGRPTIALFGPSNDILFRPWGSHHKIVIRDICWWRPCADYCRFAEPYCMTRLLPADVWPEIREHIHHLIAQGIVPAGLLKTSASPRNLAP